MRTIILSLLCAATILAMPSCHKISGDGPVVTQNINVTGFTGIYAGIDGDVYFTQDSVFKVQLVGQSNILSHVRTYVDNGILQLQFEPMANIGRHTRLTAYVSAPAAYSLGINGSGTLRVLQPLISSDLTLKINGSGDLYVARLDGANLYSNISGSGSINVASGAIRSASLQISGSGNIDLLNVAATNVDSRISGSGTTKVNVTNSLNVNISGSGDVYYIGNPTIQSSISGSGKILHY